MIRFYAQGAPSWWPFQLVSLGNKVLPRPARPRFYHVLVDNGMFKYYAKEGRRPRLEDWLAELTRFVHEVKRKLMPVSVTVILPDWLWDPGFTVEAAMHPLALKLCGGEGITCAAVAHSRPGEPMGYARTARELAGIPWIKVIAAPMKLNCSRLSPRAGRRIILEHCQLAIAEQVCTEARKRSRLCHGLGVKLSPSHVRRLQGILDSFDTTSWTRPNASVVSKLIGSRWSAKTVAEKEAFFAVAVLRLLEAGVELELPDVLSVEALRGIIEGVKPWAGRG